MDLLTILAKHEILLEINRFDKYSWRIRMVCQGWRCDRIVSDKFMLTAEPIARQGLFEKMLAEFGITL
jgi:hypothetical protein